MSILHLGYVNVFVSDFERAVTFYRDTLGLSATSTEPQFGYASFNAGPISFAVAQTDDSDMVGRHTGVGFIVSDIDAAYKQMSDAGVSFDMPPTPQPWGGTLALFKDPDGNIFYLDPGHSGDETGTGTGS